VALTSAAELAGLAAWALVAGVPAFLVVHFNLAADLRSKATRWCLTAGLVSLLVLLVDWLFFGIKVSRATLGAGFVGLPALVAGALLVAVPGRAASSPSESK